MFRTLVALAALAVVGFALLGDHQRTVISAFVLAGLAITHGALVDRRLAAGRGGQAQASAPARATAPEPAPMPAVSLHDVCLNLAGHLLDPPRGSIQETREALASASPDDPFRPVAEAALKLTKIRIEKDIGKLARRWSSATESWPAALRMAADNSTGQSDHDDDEEDEDWVLILAEAVALDVELRFHALALEGTRQALADARRMDDTESQAARLDAERATLANAAQACTPRRHAINHSAKWLGEFLESWAAQVRDGEGLPLPSHVSHIVPS